MCVSHVRTDIVKEQIETSNNITVIFNHHLIFDHSRIVETFLKEKRWGNFSLDKITATFGGFKTRDGFQQNLLMFSHPRPTIDRSEIQFAGDKYPVSLNEGYMISELVFTHLFQNKEFRIRVLADAIEFSPKPKTSSIEKYVNLLKDAFTIPQEVYLLNSEERLTSATMEFLIGRYRAVAHDLYYSLLNITMALATKDGMEIKKLRHGKIPWLLMRLLKKIQSGDYATFRESKIWRDHLKSFQHLDVAKYVKSARDAYKLRRLADYTTHFEAGITKEKISKLISSTEELANLTRHAIEGSIAVDVESGNLVLYRNLEEGSPLPVETFRYELKGLDENKILMSGKITTSNFRPSKFVLSFLLHDRIIYTDMIPSKTLDLFVRYENGKRIIEAIPKKEQPSPNPGFIHFSKKTARRLSEIIKPRKIEELKNSDSCENHLIEFLFTDFFFQLYVLSDGRFYLFSSLRGEYADKQIAAFVELKKIIQQCVERIWTARVFFSPMNILPLKLPANRF